MKLSTPDLDYFKQDVFDLFAVSQIREVGNTVYLSGIAPLKGGLADLSLVGSTVADQLDFVLSIASKSLNSIGLDFGNIATWTIYTTDIAEFTSQSSDILKKYLGSHQPACTLVEISKLIHPEQLLEITITAVKAS